MNSPEQTDRFASPFLSTMQERGFINQCTDARGLDRSLADGTVTAYVGFDATVDSLHIGHLMSLMSMKHLAAAGHNVIALVGGATSLVGDPSFRNTTRPMLTKADVARNIVGITANIKAVLGKHSDRLVVVNNDEWLGGVGLIDFMRDVGTHFTVARMLTMDSVRGRLDDGLPLTMLEFTYMLLQSADFLELSRRHGCSLQMGGSDQWGNICNGLELARRSDGKNLFGLTTPLLCSANGEKMGKTSGGAVWLSAEKLSPSDFWQFWRNVDDGDVERFLAFFTDMSMDEIKFVCGGGGEKLNAAKAILATRVTAVVHGDTAAASAAERAASLFGSAASTEPTHRLEAARAGIVDIIVQVGFATFKGEARRLIQGAGVRVDGNSVVDDRMFMTGENGPFSLVVGKKKRAVVQLG